MSFSSENGYIPVSIDEILLSVMNNVNLQFGLSYTAETFLGTNFYKYFYALAQRLQQNEIKTSEIFLKLQQYFNITNEKIQRPNTTAPGIFDFFQSKGYFVSTKPPIDADAGKAFVCVDVDNGAPDYATKKLEICNLIKDCIVGGVVSQGTEVEAITLSNGQSFDFKFYLPTKIPVKLKLTTVLSENNEFTILSPDDQKQMVFDNVNARYRLGKNFEPERYVSVVDCPWAATVLLEWSDDAGATWHDTVYDADFDKVFTFQLTDISIIET
jgi:hypothetical protein